MLVLVFLNVPGASLRPILSFSLFLYCCVCGWASYFSWILVSEPGFVLCFYGFREDYHFYVGSSVHEQYSQLDTIFNYMFYFGPPGKYL